MVLSRMAYFNLRIGPGLDRALYIKRYSVPWNGVERLTVKI